MRAGERPENQNDEVQNCACWNRITEKGQSDVAAGELLRHHAGADNRRKQKCRPNEFCCKFSGQTDHLFQLICNKCSDAFFELKVSGIEGLPNLIIAPCNRCRIGNSPMHADRIAEPHRATLPGGVVAHRDDGVKACRIQTLELIPGLRSQAVCIMAALAELSQCGRIHLTRRAAAGTLRCESSRPQLIENHFGQDAAGGVSRAEKKNLMHSKVYSKTPVPRIPHRSRSA